MGESKMSFVVKLEVGSTDCKSALAGKLSFSKETGGPGYLYDAADEVEAYQRQSYYNNDMKMRVITGTEVLKRNSLYANLSLNQLTVNSTLYTVFLTRNGTDKKAYQDWIDAGGLTSGQLKEKFKPNATTFGDKIK